VLLRCWVEQYGDRLLGIAYSYTGNRMIAEDCLQDAFVRAYRKIDQLRDRDNPFPWLVRIVINECKSRKRQNRELTMLQIPAQSVVGPEEIIVKRETKQNIHQAVMMLPDKYRIPIILHYFEDMQLDSIAEILGEKPGTVRTRLRRARERLAKLVEEGDWNDVGRSIETSQIGP
jgi:RNA polymerase sigma-70 factor (ECF subfamily)